VLIQEGGEAVVSGYFYRGRAYEVEGGDSLAGAVGDFRQLVLLAPSLDSYLYLARALLATGGREEEVEKMLDAGGRFGHSSVLDLGWAEFYRKKATADLVVSRSYYLKAAVKGRFQGFFGFSETSRLLGQPVRAFLFDVVRVSSGWLISMLMG
jgi:hypothetical protein